MKKVFQTIVLSIIVVSGALAQNASTTKAQGTYNDKSVRPIRKEDQMFRKALWFRMDLREKMNQSFHVPNNEFSKLLINAVKKGVIQPYMNDSLQTRMPLEEFLENLRIPDIQPEDELTAEMNNDDVWGGKKKTPKSKEQAEYFPQQLYLVEIREDLIFDRVRSRMYHDIQAITLIIPGEQTPTGIDKVLASFSYKELVDLLFKPTDPNTGRRIENPEAIWFNPHNSAAHLNLADAFDLRQFSAGLVKYENPKNQSIVDTYGAGKRGLIAGEQALMKLIEYEALLWSY